MIEIRKKHERQRGQYHTDAYNSLRSTLSLGDVDALFAALDSLQKKYDQYKEMVGDSLMKEVKRLDKELDMKRICFCCGKTIGKNHKFYFVSGKPRHRFCYKPTSYTGLE